MTTISVIVPSAGRGALLEQCLSSLASQEHPPDEIIVVHPEDDAGPAEIVARLAHQHRIARIAIPDRSQVRALNAGVARATGDIVAMTDDDAAPRPWWIASIVRHLEDDPELVGIGGRDLIDGTDVPAAERQRAVGRISRTGRRIGNHHLGCGPPRDVHVLKGVNMAFRRDWLGDEPFDLGLLGDGAESHNDLDVSLQMIRRGGRLRYDPDLLVDHYAGHSDGAHRRTTELAAYASAHNEVRAVRRNLGRQAAIGNVLWGFGVGVPLAPGLYHAVRSLPTHGLADAASILAAATRGRISGWRSATPTPRAR